ncbi:MAG: SDR family oxidoreductase, partial [Cobetia sp.]
KGITVNTLSPGYIATDMIMKIPEEIRESIRETIPVKRYGQPDEIARAVAFLADEKSGFITGANLDINGGQFMG